MLKKIVLIGSLTIYILFLFYQYLAPKGFCDSFNIFLCQFTMDSISGPFSFFGLLTLFSILIYNAPHKVFEKWWKFVLVSIPILLISSVFINIGLLHSNSSLFNLDADFDRFSYYILYFFFTVGSFIQIIRGYFQR